MGKRTLSFLLALVMVVGMIPFSAAPVLATETEQPAVAVYDAAVAAAVTVDGKLDEIDWRTSGKLSGGQPFDILWDGDNLYFAAVADGTLTVKKGDEVIATAEKAEGAAAIEAKVAHSNYGITVLENITLAVGESTWTGNVNLVKLVRVETFNFDEMTSGSQSAAGAVTEAADGKGIVFDIPAIEAANKKVDTLYSMKWTPAALAERTEDVAFEFTMDIEAMTNISDRTGTVGVNNSVWAGMDVILADDLGEALRFGIGNNADKGLFMNVVRGATLLGAIDLGKTADADPFTVKLLWKADKSLEVFVDGVSKGVVENATCSDADMDKTSYKNNHMVHIRATRYDYQFEYYKEALKFTITDVKMSKTAKVTYSSGEAAKDGKMIALFAANAPDMDHLGWDNAGWEGFMAGEGQVSALIYNTHVYLAVKGAGEGTVTAKLGEETETAELVEGAAILCFDETAVSLYGQTLPLQVNIGGQDAWPEGELTVGQKLAGAATVMDATKGLVKANLVTVDTASNGFTITSTTAAPMYDNSNCAYWIYNKADLASAYDTSRDTLLEQTLRIDKMPIGDVTGGYNGTAVNQAWGYEIMLEYPSVVTAGKYDFYATVVYPDAEGNLHLAAFGKDAKALEAIALGKKLGEEFKLGMLCGTDGTLTVYVDGVEIAALADARYTGNGVYKSAIMLKYMDPVTKTEGNAEASMTIKNVTVTTMGTKDLIDLEEEITSAVIFKGVDLAAVKTNLTLPATFKSAFLGEHALSWKSSDESVIESNGTIHPHLTKDKKATLSVYLDGADKALWSVEVTLPATAVVLNALLSEETVVVDGNLTENAWIAWEKFEEISGNIGALWTRGYLFLGIHSAEGETLKLEINGVAAEVDLVKGTISGYAGAQIVKNKKTGEIEIAIPLTAINFNLTDYNQNVSLKAELYKGETVATLEAILLNFSGDIAELRPLANYTKDNGPWTLLTNSISYNGTPPGKVNYAYKTDNKLDLKEGIVLSNEFLFEALPITDGAFEKAAYQANGFFYYFSDEDSTRNGVTIAASIFTTDGTNLKLRISAGQGKEGTVINLGKALGEQFRLTYFWYPDNSLDIYVDGVLVGSIANAGIKTSYLGIDVITYRYYSAKVGAEKVKFTISDQAWATTKYENVMSELTPNVVFGRTDLDHVQEDLPMVTSFASANFAALNLRWTTSDASVVTAEGKITRHATEAKSAKITVYYIDAEGNETELWSVNITVDPMSVTKQPAPAVTHTAFTAPGTVNIDGILDDEGWLLNGWFLNADQQEVVSYGAQWDQTNLYLALDLNENNIDADKVVLKIGGKTLNIDLADNFTYGDLVGAKTVINGDVIEIRMPVKQVLGIDKIEQYNLEVAVEMILGDITGKTTLRLTNVDWWATDNVHSGLPMLANNVKSVKYGTSDQPDGNQGAKQLVNGWRVYDLYNAEGKNPAGIRTYILFMKMPVYENFADRSEATHLEFDFYAKALPEWEWDEAIAKDEIARAFATYGVSFSLSDKADASKNSNVAVFGIVNTKDGLYFVVNRGAGDYMGIPLNKKVGEEFRLGLTWETNSDMVIWIDGEVYETVSGLSRWVNAVGDTSFVVNMLRNKQKPTSSADDMDVYLTNIAFGKAHSFENLISKLTFDTIRGENEKEEAIESDLVLPTFMTNGQLDHQYPITWESTDPATIDPATGKVTRPATGVKSVTLTATLDNNGTKEVKEFNLLVLGEGIRNGNALVVFNDVNPFAGSGDENVNLLFNLDKTNNSIVYAIPEGETAKTNLVVLTDLDGISRLNRESLRLFVSNDNATYTEIETYKLHNDGCNWYLYDFETDAKYIKVHYTHRDMDDTNFVNTPGDMIHAYWNDGLVIPEDAAEIDVPKTTLRDQAVAITLPEGIKAEGLHVALNGEILFHYVAKDGTVYIRVADPTTGKLQLWNSDLELADKENVYEVTYGTRETLPSGGRWVLSVKAGQTYPDGSSVAVDSLYTMGGNAVKVSTDGGYTWTGVGSVVLLDEEGKNVALSSGGWGIDSKTGRMFHEFYGPVTFNGADITKSHLITYVFYSDDGGKTWIQAKGLGKVEGDLQTNYVLSYTDLTELAGNDGEGPNVDFVFPMGAQFNNNGAFCGRVAYTTDGGLTWNYSASKITYGNETAFEGGVSEATILEREDGTLVYYARCQSGNVDNFTISYSLDHGITWLTPGATSSIYTVNTQALMMTYDFGGYDGNRLTGAPIFMWGGNNVMGGNSYIRNPLNFAVSTNGMDTFRGIQNIFFETFMEEYKTTHYITNHSVQQINGDDMYISFSRLKHGDSIYMVVNDFTNWFLRTKGAYDSFERGTTQYEGWITVKGGTEATKDQASEGNYSMLIKANSQVTRSVPYLQDGGLSVDLYVDSKSAFVFELQPAFAPIANKCAVISAKVEGTKMTLADGTELTLKEGWNTVTFDLMLRNDQAVVSVNGGEFVEITVNAEAGDWVGYITFLPTADVYVDELWIESRADTVTEATEEDEAKANEVIELIKKAIASGTGAHAAVARNAYEALTQVQQDLVNRRVPTGKSTNANDPTALINYYEALKAVEAGTNVKWISASTSLEGDIGLNFYVELPAAIANNEEAKVRFTFAGQTLDVPVADAIKTSSGYRFTCSINAKNMADTVTAQVLIGENVAGKSVSVSVKSYCEFMIENSEDAELVSLMKAMLNYGAAAQVLFGYNTDNLANADLSDADKVLADVDASGYAAQITGEEAGIQLLSASLMLETETSIRIYFKLTGDKAIGDYTFTIDGVEVKPIEKNGEYYVEIADIAAQDLDEVHTFAVGGLTVKYSGLSYVCSVLKNANAGEALVNTAKALFAYNKLAESYFN